MPVLVLTEHSEVGGLAVPLTHHVGAHTHEQAGVILTGVGDHQLSSTNLWNEVKVHG